MKSLRYAIPALVLVGLIVLFVVGLGQNPTLVPSPLIGKPVPQFKLPVLSLQSAPSGSMATPREVSTQSLIGKPFLINFFASWCVACREEHDFLLRLAHKDHVRIVGIDYKDTDAAGRAYLGENGNPYALVLADHIGNVGINFGVYGVPETYVVDAKGVIRYKQVGPLNEADFRKYIAPWLNGVER